MSSTDPKAIQVRTYLETPSPTKLTLPANACDSHVHVFGPQTRFPYDTQSKITPLDAPKEKLFALHRKLGIQRCVIVQSVVHGLDNTVVEEAIQSGGGNYLGIALVPINVSDLELRRLADKGFRGIRFNFMKHLSGLASVDQVIALSPRLANFVMHLQVHFESALVHELGPVLVKSSVPVVIDHMGRVDARKGLNHPDIQALMELLECRDIYVKVSGIDRIDADSLPADRYAAGVHIARTLVDRFPERCLWGTDWPHPNHTHIPDDGALVNALPQIATSPQVLEQILVHNPQALYHF